jgi:hypothetical protein
MIRRRWPEWWDWEMEFSPHLFKRMLDRNFTELDLRTMLERARGYRPDIVEGRWVVVTLHRRQTWEVIVEPDFSTKRLLIITAYPYLEF